jgi:hypothetical protein
MEQLRMADTVLPDGSDQPFLDFFLTGDLFEYQ